MRSLALLTVIGFLAAAAAFSPVAEAAPTLVTVEVSSQGPSQLRDVVVYFKTVNSDGQITWQTVLPPKAGTLEFELTEDRLAELPKAGSAFVTVEARWHLEAREELVFRRGDDGSLALFPKKILLAPEPVAPWLTLMFLVPGLLGGLLPVVFFRLARDDGSQGESEEDPPWGIGWLVGSASWLWQRVPTVYAVLATGVWLLAVGAMVFEYLQSGLHWMPLFWPDVVISSGNVIFAYLGSLVYVAFSLYRRSAEGIAEQPEKLFRTLGGRILSAPYVAVIAYLILSTVFPTLQGGIEALFFSFFAGLWIKVVLDFLNQIGKKFLSKEAQERLEKRLQRETAPDVPGPRTRRSAILRPTLALQRARAEYRQLEGVMGATLGSGPRGWEVVVLTDPELDPVADRRLVLPKEIGGVPVRRLPLPPPSGECDGLAADLFWDRLGAFDAPAQPVLKSANWVGDTLVAQVGSLEDLRWGRRLDAYTAYRMIQPKVEDDYDFVEFVVDDDWSQALYLPVDNGGVQGIGYRKRHELTRPDGQNWRQFLGSTRLLGFQIHSRDRLFSGDHEPDLRTLLHELGHQWLCYVDAVDEERKQPLLLLTGQGPGADLLHWDHWVDDGASCMNYRHRRWEIKSDQFIQWPLDSHEVGAFKFCPLELHLMGFLPAAKVPDIRVLQVDEKWDGRFFFTGTTNKVSLSSITEHYQERKPAGKRSAQSYRQLFVVLTEADTSGHQLAQRVDDLRALHERNVLEATDNLLKLETSRP